MEKTGFFSKFGKVTWINNVRISCSATCKKGTVTLKQLFSVELKQPDPQWKDKKKSVQLLCQHYLHMDFFVISKTNILTWNGNAFQKGKFDISEKRCHFYYENLLHSKFKPPYYQSASNKLCHIVFFLKLRVLLLTDVRNVQCYFQLLIYVSYHVCLCFQILLVTILNLCYFSGSHQTAIS